MEETKETESFFFIKPEGITVYMDIISRIRNRGLAVSKLRRIIMRPSDVEALYHDKPPKILESLHDQMDNKECILGMVRGTNAIFRLVEVCGKESDSRLCAAGTIRNVHGSKEVIRLNAIHRPKNETELEQNLLIFKLFLN